MKTLFVTLQKLFLAVCVLCAVGFTSYCFYQYKKDEDASSIRFKKYHEYEENVYPSLTLCFADYLDRNAFGNNNSLMEDYKQFLEGKIWNEYLASLDYKNLTIDIKKYLVRAYTVTHDEEPTSANRVENIGDVDTVSNVNDGKDTKVPIRGPLISAIDGIDPGHKCWTFQIPFSKRKIINALWLVLRKDIFAESERPGDGKFKVAISYHGQYIRARVSKSHWKEAEHPEITMVFHIQNMIVLKKRRTSRNTCNLDWKNDDDYQIRNLVKIFGCRPPFLTLNTSDRECNGRNQLRTFTTKEEFENEFEKKYDEPCQQVEKVLYSYDEYASPFFSSNTSIGKGGFFGLNINFQGETYMEIEQIPAYDFQNFFGNAGGYIGIFLGVSCLQLPKFFANSYNVIKKLFY